MDERTSSRELRASDEDRERAADQLRDHYTAGRLTAGEFQERLDGAYAARTTGELARQLRDLPAPPTPSDPPARRGAVGRLAEQAATSAVVVVVCVAIWLLTGADASFWPKWVALFAAARLVLIAWSRLGPGAGRRDGPVEPLGEPPPPPSLPGG